MGVESFACSATQRTNESCILGHGCWRQFTELIFPCKFLSILLAQWITKVPKIFV
jgi:hypothetical protein